MKIILFNIITLLLVTSCAPTFILPKLSEYNSYSNHTERLESSMGSLLKVHKVHGVSISCFDKGGIVKSDGFGFLILILGLKLIQIPYSKQLLLAKSFAE